LRTLRRDALLPLVLVLGLMVFSTVDADGDPLTPNGPPVVLATGAAQLAASAEAAAAEDDVPSAESVIRTWWRHAVVGPSLRVLSAWLPRARPIRGP
jgi:hypothetical protein